MSEHHYNGIRTLVITSNPDFATLWKEDPSLGHAVAVLTPHDDVMAALWAARVPDIQLVKTPADALAWAPDVVVAGESRYSKLTDLFVSKGIPVANSSAFLQSLTEDPEVSRNAIAGLFSPGSFRRYITLEGSESMVQMEALYYSLRYPEEQYILDIGDTRDSVVCVSAKEVLSEGIEKFREAIQGDLFCWRAGGLIAHMSPQDVPAMLFTISGIHSHGWIGSPVVSWTDSQDHACAFMEAGGPLLDAISRLCESYKVRGAVTLHCCRDLEGRAQVYKIEPGMPHPTYVWLRAHMGPGQSWASLWRSVAKGAKFSPKVSDMQAPWLISMGANSGLMTDDHQLVGVWPCFSHDYLFGRHIWKAQHFDLSGLPAFKTVIAAGLMNKKPLWAALEISQVERHLASWRAASLPEQEPVPPVPLAEPEIGKE